MTKETIKQSNEKLKLLIKKFKIMEQIKPRNNSLKMQDGSWTTDSNAKIEIFASYLQDIFKSH